MEIIHIQNTKGAKRLKSVRKRLKNCIVAIDNKLNDLYSLLDSAEKLSAEFSGGYSNHFNSAEDFHKALCESIIRLKSGDREEINKQYFWFAPTCDWDDLIGKDGEALANKIFLLLSDLKSIRD